MRKQINALNNQRCHSERQELKTNTESRRRGISFFEEYIYNDLEMLSEVWYNYSDGSRKRALSIGTEHLMVFIYDANGVPLGLKYRNSTYAQSVWDSYWYERNLHGDIVAIYDNSNVKLVSYTYDAWGDHVVTHHNGGNSILAITSNPIRYRGYYYDTDLGLCYHKLMRIIFGKEY